ncbi:MAG: hypothetical protein GY822_15735 [Deltaproteobacteria bacterium]|nr:hypothetical protein [Deltaproteobacteria bacterium]
MRPPLFVAIDHLLHDVCKAHPRFSGIKAEEILVVSGGAWGKNVASIRSFSSCATSISIEGKERHLELCLRPLFFLEGETRSRLQILLHELLHIDVNNPHFLDEKMRHAYKSQKLVDGEAKKILDEVIDLLPATSLGVLGFHGEAMMRSFRVRPIPETSSRIFNDDDVFLGPVQMFTDVEFRTGWW